MKRKLLLIGLAFMSLSSMYAQNRVGLGSSTLPNESSILDMGATNLGVLVPRVSLKDEDDKTTIAGTNYPESLLVYNTGEGTSNLKKGFYFWLDGKWNALVAKTTLQTDETLTSLIISDGADVKLTYTDEKKVEHELAISQKLIDDTSFTNHIKSLVTSTATGVELTQGTGITIKTIPSNTGGTNVNYEISANSSEINLDGDVTGAAGDNTVVKINGVSVEKPVEADDKQALVYDHASTTWKPGKPIVEITNISNKGTLSTGTDGVINVGDGTDALLKNISLSINAGTITSSMIGAGQVSKENIAANAVDTSKILSGGNSQVLTTADDGTVTWVAQNTIKPTGANLTTDGIITIEGGEDDGKTGAGVLLADTKISIKNESIGIEKLAESKAENMVLTTGADKKPVWVAQNTIKPTGADLTTDGIITIKVGEDDGNTGVGVLLADAKISIKDESIGTKKLAESTDKNMVLTTGADKKPVWESKYTTITSTPVETKEVIDGKKVFTLKIANGKVTKASDAIDYNTIIDPILIDNIDYLLSAQIFNKTNSLLVSNVTDVVNTKDTSVQFRFGSNNMYSTLPAGTEYVVILKYVSTVAAD